MSLKPRITRNNLKNIFVPPNKRRKSISLHTFKEWGDLDRSACTCQCIYTNIKSYILYAAKTSGKRCMTVFDVVTDINTFLILWKDDYAAYWACFLLSSILLPYIVFWASSHNFENACRAHSLFQRKNPKNCCEKFTRIYYCLSAMPIIGVFISMLTIIVWWFTEIFLGLFRPSLHKKYVENMAKRENAKFTGRDIFEENEKTQQLFRSIPLIPSVKSARFLTIIELFFESIPQCLLQIYIYVLGTSSYFTFEDVMLSVTASILNIIMNANSITKDAHSVGMNVFDYVVYFMGDRVASMLSTMVPVSKVLISSKRHVCNLTGFTNMYQTDACEKLSTLIQKNDKCPKNLKTIILPSLKTFILKRHLIQLTQLLAMTRYKKNIHITMLSSFYNNADIVISNDFLKDSKPASNFQRGEACTCMENCQECLNICQCCSIKLGDFLCGEREYSIDEALHLKRTPRKCCCFNLFSACLRREKPPDRRDSETVKKNKIIRTTQFLWPIISDYKSDEEFCIIIATKIILYSLVGDYALLIAIYNVLKSEYELSKTFCIMVESIYFTIMEKHDRPYKKWFYGEKKEEINIDFRKLKKEDLKNINFRKLNNEMEEYEQIFMNMISNTIETV